MNRIIVTRQLGLAGLALAFGFFTTASSAQSWEYRSYRKNMGGQYTQDNFIAGTISIEEKAGESFFRMTAGAVDACLRGAIPAKVTKTEATTIIEPQIALVGCEKFRYVIRNDGSGGQREIMRGDQWVNGRFDHGLTPAK